MSSKKISYISIVIVISMILELFSPIASYAAKSVDYKDLVIEMQDEHGKFATPISQIKITHNGNVYTSERTQDTVETIDGLDYIRVEDSKDEFKVGDIITVSSSSSVGTGGLITAYDFQIGKDYKWNGPSDYDYKSSSSFTYELDRPGTWVIFLNVRDSHKIPGTSFENWSDWGNWRTEEPPRFKPPGMDIKGWYFSAIKFEVKEPSKPVADFEIRYNGENITNNQSNPVQLDRYPMKVDLINKSTVSKGKIVGYEWEHYTSNGWQYLANTKDASFNVNTSVKGFRLRVITEDGTRSEWLVGNAYSVINGGNPDPDPDPDPPGDIRAVLTGDSVVEENSNARLDSSKSTATYTIVERKWYKRGGKNGEWQYLLQYDNEINIRDDVGDRYTYLNYKVVIKDSRGNTDETIHRVDVIEEVEPEIFANLEFDPLQGFEPVKISLEDYYANNEIEVNLWVTGEHSSYVGTELGRFLFFQNITDAEIRKYEGDERGAMEDPNFIDRVQVNTRDDPESMRDAVVRGTFKFRPQNPVVKASLLLRSRYVNGPVGFATAYHTVELDIDSIPPETELTIPYPFYPKEIDNLEQKTITWTYSSEQDIPYQHSIVSLYKLADDGIYEAVFTDRLMTERKLVVQAKAEEKYKIEVKVVDQLGKKSNTAEGEFTIIGAVPIIDLKLDTSEADILGMQVDNLTPKEIEELFPTSYTTWKIEDINGKLIVDGEGEVPKSIILDKKFDRGKYRVTQYAVNTIGATAHDTEEFEIYSYLNFYPRPYTQFEGDMIRLDDVSKYITNKTWHIKDYDEVEYSDLQLNENNEITRDEGRYDIKLKGQGYFEFTGEAEREVIKPVVFLSTKPKSAFLIGGNLKMYKEIILDGSLSEDVTDERLQQTYPIIFDDPKTMFIVEPITSQNGDIDTSRNDYILGEGKEIENGKVVFKAKKVLSMRIDKEGWYRASYKVYNGRKESDWYTEEFYVSPELIPNVDINVSNPVVYRDPNNQLKAKLEVVVDYSSPDDLIDLDASKLLIYYDKNNDGDFTNDGLDSNQWVKRNSNNLLGYFSNIQSNFSTNKATFTLYIDNPEKNHFGKFKFEFVAVEKPSIPNKTDLGEVPIMQVDTILLDDKKKIILIDNLKPNIELETTKVNTVEIWIIEESDRPLDTNKILQQLELNRIKATIYLIKKDGTVEIKE